jgi:hypothetical protein
MRSWILIALIGVLPPAALAIAFGGAAPPGTPKTHPRPRTVAAPTNSAVSFSARPAESAMAPIVAPPATIVAPPVDPETRAARLVANLKEACRVKNEIEIARVIAKIGALLATENPAVDNTIVNAAMAGGVVAARLVFLIHTFPDRERRAGLRARLASAAAPAPKGAPSMNDLPGVAAYLTGPAVADDRIWVLKRLDDKALESPRVRESLTDIVLRSPEGGALATAALHAMGRGPREEAETLALRTLAAASDTAILRCAVRLLGSTASRTGVPHLLRIARDGADTTSRRLAADGLVGKSLGTDGVDILGAIAESAHEDILVRQHARRALESEVLRRGPDATLAREILERIHTDVTRADPRDNGRIDAFLVNEAPTTKSNGSTK